MMDVSISKRIEQIKKRAQQTSGNTFFERACSYKDDVTFLLDLIDFQGFFMSKEPKAKKKNNLKSIK